MVRVLVEGGLILLLRRRRERSGYIEETESQRVSLEIMDMERCRNGNRARDVKIDDAPKSIIR